jgi:hypothetical protein
MICKSLLIPEEYIVPRGDELCERTKIKRRMTTFDIRLYQSKKLYNQFGNEVIDKVKRYIEAADSRINHQMDVTTEGYVLVPQETGECPRKTITTDYPCDSSFEKNLRVIERLVGGLHELQTG